MVGKSEKLCLLCVDKKANQPGSHLFTHALVKQCTNEIGKKGRDSELMLGLSQLGEQDLYVGRNVSSEKIREVKGRDLTDEEISLNENELVVDDIYCIDCEKLFGKIESAFSTKVLGDIREKNLSEILYPLNVIMRLYFYIQVWRASSFGYNDWHLPKEEEEGLRKLIFKACKEYDAGLSSEVEEEILAYPVIVNYMEVGNKKDDLNMVLIPNNTNPYVFLLCDFIFELFESQAELKKTEKFASFYGLNDGISSNEINWNEKNLTIRRIPNDKRVKIMTSVALGNFYDSQMEYLTSTFQECFLETYGEIPSEENHSEFMKLFFDHDEVPVAMVYSRERILGLVEVLRENKL